MWSFMLLVLLAPALVTAGLTEAHLRRAFEQRVRESMVIECDKYVPRDRREEIADAGMGTVACLYDTFDYSKFFEQMVNATTTEEVMVPVGDFCKHRKRLQGCFHQFLVGMAPCAPPSVRVQVESMKLAVTELFSYFCNDDSDRVRPSEVLAGVTETYLQNVFNQPEYQFMVHDCETYVSRDRIEEITIAEWGLLICLHNTFDYSIVYVQMVNATTTEEMMVPIERLCKRRVRIQRCIHQFLEKMAPCSPPSVTVQVANMKLTVTDLISYFCRDDSANVRRELHTNKSFVLLRDKAAAATEPGEEWKRCWFESRLTSETC